MKYILFIFQCVFIIHLNAGIENHFKKIETKSRNSEINNIDFVYMINLDHRTEKFQSTVEALKPYGIHPYRFSAINGWNLSFEAIDELGIVFQPGMQEGPIATVYRHVDGRNIRVMKS